MTGLQAGSLRILILHNAYQSAGGEDGVVKNEAGLLENAGHRVVVQQVSNDEIRSTRDKISALVRIAYNPARASWTRDLLERHTPDVVHVHNFFPLLTFAVHETVKAAGIPVVQTLHNYRLGCAAATFERDAQVCESCLGRLPLPALRHRCYRGSLVGTAALIAMQRKAFHNQFLVRNVDRFIALTEFARSKYVEMGLPSEAIVVKPNFLDLPGRPNRGVARDGFLFVGRLSVEKGVSYLVEAWKSLPEFTLTIAGDGPMRRELERDAPNNVRFLGQVDSDVVRAQMRKAYALIMPSIWYEGFPLTLVEAFANGLPVLCSDLGSMREIVELDQTGLHFRPASAESIRVTVEAFASDPARAAAFGARARDVFEKNYCPSRNLDRLLAIYDEARRVVAGQAMPK